MLPLPGFPAWVPLSVNWRAPLNRGLIGWYLALPQHMAGLRWADLTGFAPVATLSGIAATSVSGWGASLRPGGWGELRVDGTDDSAHLGPTALFSLTSGAVALWVWRNTDDLREQTFVGVSNFNEHNSWWLEFTTAVNGQMSMGMYVEPTEVFTSFTDAALFTAGRWWHVIGTGGALGNAIYVNGALATTSYTNGTAATTGWWNAMGPPLSMEIGRYQVSSPLWLAGKVDDVRLYNRGLTAQEARSLYMASRTGYQNELQPTWSPRPVAQGAAARGAPPPRRQSWRVLRRVA
jgi:Concanavalin A-like lectin/glucanases superfamily